MLMFAGTKTALVCFSEPSRSLYFIWGFNARGGYCIDNAGYYLNVNAGSLCGKNNLINGDSSLGPLKIMRISRVGMHLNTPVI